MLDTIYSEMKENAKKEFDGRRIVLGEGNRNTPQIMLIGEAPGANEEKEGRPFVGAAGKNLNEFLDIVGLKREDIFISNAVKIRPFKLSPKTGNPINRPPNKEEVSFFLPYLLREIDAISPKILVTLGNTPLHAVYGNNKNIGDLHGKPIKCEKYTLFPLYHPASVIYNRALKEVYINDISSLGNYLKQF